MISRRDFIKVTGLAGGGLVFGFHLNARPKNASVIYKPNLFIEINSKNIITLKILEQEMGQGIGTSIVMLLAEELEVDVAQVKTEFLPYNKHVPNYKEKYGDCDSGGSYSTIRKWESMRRAGAMVKQVLINAAAKKWNTPVTQCYAENGSVLNRRNGKKFRYGELCESALLEKIPEDITLKERGSFKIIGKSMPDIKNKFIVKGSLKYSIDEFIPGMVYAAIIMNPTKDAKVKSFEPDEVLKLNGVTDVIGLESIVKDDDFNGSEGGLAIIGNSTWTVFKAKRMLEKNIVWDYGEFATKSFNGIKKLFKDAIQGTLTESQHWGDVEKCFAADIVKETAASYETPYLAHALMEPLNAIVYVQDNACEIWAGTQSPQYTSLNLSRILNIPIEHFLFHTYPSGGGFGRRFCTDFVTQAALISKKIKKPVKLTWTREDEIQHGRYQSLREDHYRGGLDKHNDFIAMHYRGISTSLYPPGPNFVYHVKHYKAEYKLLDSIVHDGTWRSVGQYHTILGRECFIDEIAYLAGEDPMAFRVKHLQKEFDHVSQSDVEDDFVKYRKNQITIYLNVLNALKTIVKWSEKLPEGEGLGLAISDYGFNGEKVGNRNSVCGQVAHVKVRHGVWEIIKITAVVDCGLVVNPGGAVAQVEGSIHWALSPIIYDGIDIEKGSVLQSNFHDFQVLRISGAPETEVHIMPSSDHPNGLGETSVPPVTPAILNGIFAASGIRVRKIPVKELKYKHT